MSSEFVAIFNDTSPALSATPDTDSLGVPGDLNKIPFILPNYKAGDNEKFPVLAETLTIIPTECTMTTFNFYAIYDLTDPNLPEIPNVGDEYITNGSSYEIVFASIETLSTKRSFTLACIRTSGTEDPSTTGSLSKSGVKNINYSEESHTGNKFITGLSSIKKSGTTPVYLTLKPIRENDTGVCNGMFTYRTLMCPCKCNITITNAGQSTVAKE